jgi:hypothetical protein
MEVHSKVAYSSGDVLKGSPYGKRPTLGCRLYILITPSNIRAVDRTARKHETMLKYLPALEVKWVFSP